MLLVIVEGGQATDRLKKWNVVLNPFADDDVNNEVFNKEDFLFQQLASLCSTPKYYGRAHMELSMYIERHGSGS